MTLTEEIREKLYSLRDTKYADFSSSLTPGVERDAIIGVRTPALRSYAKELLKEHSLEELNAFFEDLPHEYFDENQLHAFLISGMKDYDVCMEKLKEFLPHVNNWATCDQMSPKIFKKHKSELLKEIKVWIASKETYTVRFGVGMLMEHFLDEDYDVKYPKTVARIRSSEYYVNMMIAWYFATALAKQYDTVLPFLEEKKLAVWTHNKTIQKAVESYRISEEQKAYLRTLKVKEKKV